MKNLFSYLFSYLHFVHDLLEEPAHGRTLLLQLRDQRNLAHYWRGRGGHGHRGHDGRDSGNTHIIKRNDKTSRKTHRLSLSSRHKLFIFYFFHPFETYASLLFFSLSPSLPDWIKTQRGKRERERRFFFFSPCRGKRERERERGNLHFSLSLFFFVTVRRSLSFSMQKSMTVLSHIRGKLSRCLTRICRRAPGEFADIICMKMVNLTVLKSSIFQHIFYKTVYEDGSSVGMIFVLSFK